MEKSENTTVEEQISKKPRIQNEEHIEPIVVNDPLKKKDKGKEKVVEEHKVDKEKDFRSDLHTSTEKGRKKERSESSERVQRMDLVILAEKPKRTLAEGEGKHFILTFVQQATDAKRNCLDFSLCLTLSRVSREIFGWVKKFIEHHFWFAPKDNLKWYFPTKLKGLSTSNRDFISGLSVYSAKQLEFVFFDRKIQFSTQLTYLNVGDTFNSPLDLSRYTHLERLILGKAFSQALTNLPTSLKELTLAVHFQAEINYPPNLQKLKIKGENPVHQRIEFQKIRNIVTLKELTLPDYFDQDLQPILPPHLKKLSLGVLFKRLINVDSFSNSFQSLKMKSTIYQHPIVLVPSIRRIVFPQSYKFPIHSLPPNITHLELPEKTQNLKDQDWPLGLKVLKVGFIPSEVVSNKLQELSFTAFFDCPIGVDFLFMPITKLTFGYLFDQNVHAQLPSLPQQSEVQYYSLLPHSLEVVNFGEKFNQNIEKLPALLMELRFGKTFNSVVTQYPPMLTVLHYGEEYQKAPTLPQTLQKLIFPCFGKIYETEEKKVAFKEALPWLINFLHE